MTSGFGYGLNEVFADLLAQSNELSSIQAVEISRCTDAL
jgi:hypothetical protein